MNVKFSSRLFFRSSSSPTFISTHCNIQHSHRVDSKHSKLDGYSTMGCYKWDGWNGFDGYLWVMRGIHHLTMLNKHCPYHHGNNHTCIISMIRIIIIVKHDQEKNKLTLDMANGQGGQGASLRKAATGMIISCASNFHIMQVAANFSFLPQLFLL